MEYETPPAHLLSGRLHPATIIVELLRSLRGLAWVIAVAIVIRISRGGQGSWIELAIAAMGSFSALGAVLRYLTVRFGIEQDQFIIQSGLVFRQRRTIPLARIQNVNLKRDLLHQMFGVSQVGIETASGAGAEAELSVLACHEAENLRAMLLARQVDGAGAFVAAVPVEPPPVYAAKLRTLLLAGATQIQAGAVIGAIVATVYFVGDLVDDDGSFIQKLLSRISSIHVSPLLAGALAVGGIALAGWIVSIVGSVVRYHDFRVMQEGTRLRIRFGLFTRHERAFPVKRVQLVRVESPLLQRKLGLCRIVAETAGSVTPTEKESGGSSMLCPLIKRSETADLLGRALPGLIFSDDGWMPVSRLTIRRGIVRLTMLGAMLLTPAYLHWGTHVLWLVLPWLAGAVLYSIARFKALGHREDERFVMIRWGVFTRVHCAIPVGKIQSLLISQSPLQRRLGLASVQIATASTSFGGGVEIPDLPFTLAVRLEDQWSLRSVSQVRAAVVMAPATWWTLPAAR